MKIETVDYASVSEKEKKHETEPAIRQWCGSRYENVAELPKAKYGVFRFDFNSMKPAEKLMMGFYVISTEIDGILLRSQEIFDVSPLPLKWAIAAFETMLREKNLNGLIRIDEKAFGVGTYFAFTSPKERRND